MGAVSTHTIDTTSNTADAIFKSNLATDLAALASAVNANEAANAPGAVSSIAYNKITTAGAINMSGAEVASALVETILEFAGTNASNVAFTLPSVAACVAALEAAGLKPVAGFSWKFTLINENVDNATLTFTQDSGTTWTLSGTAQTVAQGTQRSWIMTLTSLTAGTAASLGEVTVAAAP